MVMRRLSVKCERLRIIAPARPYVVVVGMAKIVIRDACTSIFEVSELRRLYISYSAHRSWSRNRCTTHLLQSRTVSHDARQPGIDYDTQFINCKSCASLGPDDRAGLIGQQSCRSRAFRNSDCFSIPARVT